MPMPTLTYPPADYSYTVAFLAKERKDLGPLAYAFHQEADSYQETHRIQVEVSSSADSYGVKKAHCDAINSYYAGLRAHMADWMQQYILAHGGKVDSWPDPATSLYSTFEQLPGDKITFDYFGADYMIFPDGHVDRETPDLVYRNEYRYAAKTPYQNLLFLQNWLKQKSAKDRGKKQNTSLFLRILSILGAVYCVFAVLITLGEVFFGIGNSVIALNESAGDNGWMAVGTMLLALPLYLYSFVQAIFSDISPALGVVFTVILVGAWVLGAVVCWSVFHSYQQAAKEWKQEQKRWAKAEEDRKKSLNSLQNSPEEWAKAQKTEAEEQAKKAEMEAFAEEWHRAWFDWACQQKYKAG